MGLTVAYYGLAVEFLGLAVEEPRFATRGWQSRFRKFGRRYSVEAMSAASGPNRASALMILRT